MGGGGFTTDERSAALDRLALELAAVPAPRVCFLPTASGDPREQVTRFYDRFGEWTCEPSTLSLFHLARDRVDPVAHLLAQDVIYVGGGSMRNMLAIWREHSIDVAMRKAWASGTVLAGLSAGAMCWFEGGVSKSGGMPEAVSGIGLLPGSLSVHMDSEPERLPVYFEAVGGGRLPRRLCRGRRRRARVPWSGAAGVRGVAAGRAGGAGGRGRLGGRRRVVLLACRSGCCRVRPVVWTGRSVRSKRTGWPSCASCGRGQGGGGTRPAGGRAAVGGEFGGESRRLRGRVRCACVRAGRKGASRGSVIDRSR